MKKALATATLALLATAAAHAEPFATRYAGTVDNSNIPGVTNGHPYYVTLVFDNGGNTVLNQSWGVSHLTCVIWEMAGGTIVYAQDLTAHPPEGAGTFTTGANGYPSSTFGTLATGPGQYTGYSATSPITGNAAWVANGTNPVFGYQPAPSVDLGFHDADGGVQMAANRWGPPQQFSGIGNGQCAAPAAPLPTPTTVPTLGHAGLVLMALLLGAFGWLVRRRA